MNTKLKKSIVVFAVTLLVIAIIVPITAVLAVDTSDYGSITIYEPVNADFSATPTSGVAPWDVDFTNLSTGDYDTCSWDFGDGGTSSVCFPPTYTYNTPGYYTVSLTVSGDGGEDTETKTDYIIIPDPPNADFSGTPISGIGSLVVDFTSCECEPPTYTYNTPGVYTVSLTVSGYWGEETSTKTDYIIVYEAVQADFSGAPTSGVAPLDVDFTNLSTSDYDTCSWDFGDGGTSAECSPPTYTYNTFGTYTVSLTVSGNGGEDTETKTDYIISCVHADFSGTPTSGIAPLDVYFTNLSHGDYDTCSWDFGDGGTSSECEPPTYIYNTHGLYTVSLTVSGNGGEDTETKIDYITAYEEVQAEFSATPTSGVPPLTVDFTNLSTGDFDTCSWDFGDGSTYVSCGKLSHIYNTPGTFTVSLTVSGLGGEDTETKIDYIYFPDPPNADFSGTPISGIGSLVVDFTNLSTGDYNTCSWTFGDGLTVGGLCDEDTETKIDYITVFIEYRIFIPITIKD
jgi:PKD repeat protein